MTESRLTARSDAHPLVARYVADICRQVKARDLRPEIQDELTNHLEELIEARIAEGMEVDAAARWAIKQMGDAANVAKGLNRVHKPRVPWTLLGSLTLLLIIALVVMHALTRAYAASDVNLSGQDFLYSHAYHIALGLAVMVIVSRIPYQLLLRKTMWIYTGIIALMILSFLWGVEINGSRSGYIHFGFMAFNLQELSVYIFVILGAISLVRSDPGNWRDAVRQLAMFSIAPLVLYGLAPSSSSLIIYAAAYTGLLAMYRRGWRWLLPHAGLLLIMCTYLISRYGLPRLTAFIYRDETWGYMYQQIGEALRTSSWQKQGVESLVQKMPYLHSELTFTFIFHSFGWMFAVLVLVSVLLLLFQFTRAARQVRETAGRMIICAVVSVFAVKFLWSIGMSLGLLPILSISLPFISYGGSAVITQLAAIGLIYSIYRRKDMMPGQGLLSRL